MKKYIEYLENLSADKTVVMSAFGDAESLAAVAVAVKVIGSDRLHVLHIDHGLLREGEKEAILASLCNMGVSNVHKAVLEKFTTVYTVRTAEGKVLGPLSTMYNPSEKREIINCAIKKELEKFSLSHFENAVVLGTHGVYAFDIDFGGDAAKIAREAGAVEWLLRQPFPLASLAIRILCNDCAIALTTAQRCALSDVVAGFGGEFCSKLIPFRSVGYRDGTRSYKSIAVISQNGADSDFTRARDIAQAISDKLGFVSRVLLRVDDGGMAESYHGRPMFVSEETLAVIRSIDSLVSKSLADTDAVQFFAVLLPFAEDIEKKYSVAIRAVSTSDFKTAEPLIVGQNFDSTVLSSLAEEIKKMHSGIDMVFYDITSKPPAAIEFE